MDSADSLTFGPFCLNVTLACLRHGETIVPLRQQTFRVLRYLVEHPHELVTPEALYEHAWDGSHVSPSVLRTSIREIRAALGDSVQTPQYVETVRGQGYRFVGRSESEVLPEASPAPGSGSLLVGRQQERKQLMQWLELAMTGTPQLVFISGEVGIGKSALVNAFVGSLTDDNGVRIGWGQCIEHRGEGEAYLPVLDILGQLGRAPEGESVVAVLRQVAPSWLIHLPALVPEAEREPLLRQVQGATGTRMLRELAEALEMLTAQSPLVWVLEDLHWSDPSTVDLLPYLARRRSSARLMVVGTHRSLDLSLSGHPLQALMHELLGHGQCRELGLRPLSAESVAAYIDNWLGGAVSAEVPALLYKFTQGNALFMTQLLAYLVKHGLISHQAGYWTVQDRLIEDSIRLPQELQLLLIKQIEALSLAEQRVLEVASVAGEVFAVAEVAAGLDHDLEAVEAQVEEIARTGHFIADIGLEQWPDGTLSGHYQFQHALYRQALYHRVGSRRRAQHHRQIAARLETGYGTQTGEVAVLLAFHFARGYDPAQALPYLVQATRITSRRQAYQETVSHCTAGLKLLTALPDSPERTQQELDLQMTLGQTALATKGLPAAEAEHAFTRAQELSQQVGKPHRLFGAIMGLWTMHYGRTETGKMRDLGHQLLNLAQRIQDPALLLLAHIALGQTFYQLGEFAAARGHFEEAISLASSQPQRSLGVKAQLATGLAVMGWTLLQLGYPDLALQRCHEAVSLAQEIARPYSLTQVQIVTALVYQHRRDAQACHEVTEAAMITATEQGYPFWEAAALFYRGWVLVERGRHAEGIAQMRQALAAWRAAGSVVGESYLLAVLAEACGRDESTETGQRFVAEGLDIVHQTGERCYEAELHRLKGEFLLKASSTDAPQAALCFHHALDIACGQQSKAQELRAAMSLARLWQQQGKRAEARGVLAPVYDWFTEGFDTPDLQEATALLEALGGSRFRFRNGSRLE